MEEIPREADVGADLHGVLRYAQDDRTKEWDLIRASLADRSTRTNGTMVLSAIVFSSLIVRYHGRKWAAVRKLLQLITLILASSFFSVATDRPVITGRVVDNLGKPLNDVVRESRFEAFSRPHPPSRVKVRAKDCVASTYECKSLARPRSPRPAIRAR